MRPYWKAIYNDGTEVLEFMPGGVVPDFYSIDKDRLARFELVCSSSLVVRMDTATGIFYINGVEATDTLITIAYNQPVDYAQGLIQFKKAHVAIINFCEDEVNENEVIPIFGDEVIQTINMGYKFTHDDCFMQTIAIYNLEAQSLSFELKATNLKTQETLTNMIEVV